MVRATVNGRSPAAVQMMCHSVPSFSGLLARSHPGQRPLPAVEPKSVEWRGRGERADAIELDSRPLESAFLQHSARSRIAHARAGVERLAAEIVERVIDHGACRFGGVAVAPERNGEPITDLGRLSGAVGNSAGA